MHDVAPPDEPRLIEALGAIDAGQAAEAIAPYLDSALRHRAGRLASTLGLAPNAGRIVRVERFDDGGFFVRSRVLLLHRQATPVERLFSETWSMHLGAFGPWGLRLPRRPRLFLGELLREQAQGPQGPLGLQPGAPAGQPYRVDPALQGHKNPSEMDPLRLAHLCAEAFGRRQGRSHLVLGAREEVADYVKQANQQAGLLMRHLIFDTTRWADLGPLVQPPALAPGPTGGWVLRYFTLFGQDALRTHLTRQTIRIAPDFALTTTAETLSTSLLTEIHAVRGRALLVSGKERQSRTERRGGWSG